MSFFSLVTDFTNKVSKVQTIENQYTKLLKVINIIRQKIGSTNELRLPQVCVIGDQSSGKSSTLEILTGIKFPVDAGMCTRCPIVVQCKKNIKLNHNIFYDRSNNNINENKLKDYITKVQNINLNGKKISKKEIYLQVQGPTQMNITLIDLPGIIHNGEEKNDISQLIKKFIENDRTLILVCTEADKDNESAEALELANKFDKSKSRTLRILTKFDIFGSEQNKQRAINLILKESENNYGSHGVVCRYKGDKYNKSFEDSIFSNFTTSHVGVDNLKKRLPKIYAELIKKYIPNLKEDIKNKINKNNILLEKLGKNTLKPIEIIDLFKKNFININKYFEKDFIKFKSNIKSKVDIISKEWIKKNYENNVFQPILFQGKNVFDKCLSNFLEHNWKPVLIEYINNIMIKLKEAINIMENKTPSYRLFNRIKIIWTQFIEDEIILFKNNNMISYNNETFYGTTNNYILKQFKSKLVIPENYKELLLNKLETIWNTQKSYNNVKNEISSMIDFILNDRKKDFYNMNIIEQQIDKIYNFIKVYINVEVNTFTDNIMKNTKYFIKKINKWIDKINNIHNIESYAIEEKSITNKRDKLKERNKILNECLVMVHEI